MRNKYLQNQHFWAIAINNYYSCTMKYILRSRVVAAKIMDRIIVNGDTTSMWLNPWLNHKSNVDLLGWHSFSLCPAANANVNYIMSEGLFHPETLTSSRQLLDLVYAKEIDQDRNSDYWKTASKTSFIFAAVWNSIKRKLPAVGWAQVIWHRTTAKRMSYTGY